MAEEERLAESSTSDQKRPLLDSTDLKNDHRRLLSRLWHKNWCPWIPARYVLAIMGFLGFVNVYALRVNLSMAIVVMVNNTKNATLHNQFNWSEFEQGWVLGAFFYGYMITQVPGGWLAERYGGKMIYSVGILMTAVLTLLTPTAADISVWALVALRVAEGFFEGVTFPAMHAMWGKWAPSAERSILTTITYAGPFVGNVVSFPLSAVLCQYGFAGGWPSVFYVFGSIGTLWFGFWLLLIFDTPSTHPRISQAERKHIESNTVTIDKSIPVPWFQIFTSPAMWAIIVAHFCNNWMNYTMLTCLPKYMKDVLQLGLNSENDKNSLIKNGLYSAIPYVAFTFASLGSGQIADLLRAKCLSTTVTRKLMNTVGCFLAGGALVATGYFAYDQLTAVTGLTIAVGCSGLVMAGFNINHIDIAPRFAGVLMGITNTIATIPGFVGPQVATAIALRPNGTPGSPSYTGVFKDEWREVFIISAEVYIFGAIIFLILANGEKQWWADGVKGGGCGAPGWSSQPSSSDEKIYVFEKKNIIKSVQQ